MTEIKPTSFKNGVPKAERNGMFGSEEKLIELAKAGKQLVAIVTYEFPRVMHDEIADETYPVAAIVHIEPLFDQERSAAADGIRAAAYKDRTGTDVLDLSGLDDEDGE